MTVRRILMTGDCVGGVWTYALELAAALAPHDVAVTLFCAGGPLSSDLRADAAAVDNLTLVHRDWRLEWQDAPEDDLARSDALLAEMAADLRPDVVHINGFAHAARRFAAPVVVVAHSCVPTWFRACHGVPAPARFDGYRSRLRAGVAGADGLVAPTAAFLGMFGAENRVLPRATRAVRNGRDPRRFTAGVKRPVALAAGRFWDPAKNIDALVAAAARAGHEIRIAALGRAAAFDGGDPPANVTVLGDLPSGALAAEMATAAVFVAPARYEPFGLAILEAAFSRCALVLSDIPTLRELWDGAACFVSPDDPAAIAATIDALLADPARSAAAGDLAHARAQNFTAAAMAEGTFAFYARLADARVAA